MTSTQSLNFSREMYVALMAAYRAAGGDGLTDEEAAQRSGIGGRCPWKRCNELRNAGMIRQTDRTRKASSGRMQMVCVVA